MDESGDLEFYVPPEHEGGDYANALMVWHTKFDVAIDFAAIQLPRPKSVSRRPS